MGRLDGRVAVITGAAQGLGAAYARRMAEEGAKIVIGDVVDAGEVIDDITKAGGEAVALAVDVTDDGQVKAMVDAAIERFGKVDIMVTNAGLFPNLTHYRCEDIPEETWEQVFRVNVTGVWKCLREVLPHMRAQGHGKIVNIASSSVFRGVPMIVHYVASKGAILALTRSLAREVGDANICVNAVAPGLTETEAVLSDGKYTDDRLMANVVGRSLKRHQVPDDVVGAVLFLASSDSDFMTGQTLLVDGGGTMH